jgi:hypothetical protein
MEFFVIQTALRRRPTTRGPLWRNYLTNRRRNCAVIGRIMRWSTSVTGPVAGVGNFSPAAIPAESVRRWRRWRYLCRPKVPGWTRWASPTSRRRHRGPVGGDVDICWRIQEQSLGTMAVDTRVLMEWEPRATMRDLASQWKRYGRSNAYLRWVSCTDNVAKGGTLSATTLSG